MISIRNGSIISRALEAYERERESVAEREDARRREEEAARRQELEHSLLRTAARVLRLGKADLAEHLHWDESGEDVDVYETVTEGAKPYLSIDGLRFYEALADGLIVVWPDGRYALIRNLADLGAYLVAVQGGWA